MPGAAEASRAPDIRGVRTGHRRVERLVLMVLSELKRARAAEQRYEDLKRSNAAMPARTDIVRDVFQEFYADLLKNEAAYIPATSFSTDFSRRRPRA